jgi:hypothetical protein
MSDSPSSFKLHDSGIVQDQSLERREFTRGIQVCRGFERFGNLEAFHHLERYSVFQGPTVIIWTGVLKFASDVQGKEIDSMLGGDSGGETP